MKKLSFVLGLLSLLSLSVAAQEEREMRWENVTALYFAATNGTDRENALQQYLLFDDAVLNDNQELISQYRTFVQEFGQMSLNAAVPEGVKEMDEGIAKVKQIIKEHPELAEELKEQIKELEAQKREFAGYVNDEVKEYTYDPATILKKLTQLAVNKKAYTGCKDIGKGLFAIAEGPCYGPVQVKDISPVFQKGSEYTWGAIDSNGRQVIPAKYNDFPEFYPDLDIIVLTTKDKSGKFRAGACGYDGRVRIPFIYDEAFKRGSFIWTDNPPKFHLYIFKKDGKYGFIGLDGEVLQPCVYAKIEGGGFWSVTKDYKNYGLVDDADGRLVVPLEYKGAWVDDGMVYKKRHDGKVEVCDSSGKLIRIEDAKND